MLRKFQLLAILFAWLAATGAQWDFMQVAAWGKMFTAYSKSMPVLRAAQMTFGGEMCSLCKAVNEAKQQETAGVPLSGKDFAKIVLLFQPADQIVFSVAASESWSRSDHFLTSAQRSAPPIPPPRSLIA